MSSVEARLTELGSTLPTPPAVAGAYVPAVRTGNLLYLAGTLPMKDGKVASLGKVGREVDIAQAAVAAKLCVLNALANAKAALGSLDVAMNIHAIEVERGSGRPMMSGFHAFFSVGGFSGAALVTALLSQTFTLFSAAVTCSALICAALVVTAPRLLKTAAPASESSGAIMALPRGPVVILSVLAVFPFFGRVCWLRPRWHAARFRNEQI